MRTIMQRTLAAMAIGFLTISSSAFAAPLSGGASGGGADQGGSGAPGGGTGIPGAAQNGTTDQGVGTANTHGRHYWSRGTTAVSTGTAHHGHRRRHKLLRNG